MAEIDFGKLTKVKLSDINVGQRVREDYGDISELARSIQFYGLIHPIVVYSPNGEPPYQLIAGGRRLSACAMLKLEEVSVRIYDKPVSADHLKAIELFENLHRKNLFYVEETKLKRQLDIHMKKIKGEKIAKSPGAPGHSMRDTARMLGQSVGSVSMDIALAEAIEQFPELGLDKMANKTIAYKALTRIKQALNTMNMVKAAEKSMTDLQREIIDAYIVGDFLELSKNLPSGTFQLIEVDPPYGVDLQGVRDAASDTSQMRTLPYHEVEDANYAAFCSDVIRECWRLAAPDAWIVWWLAVTRSEMVYDLLSSAGWKGSKVPALWKKGTNPGPTPLPSYNMGNNYEMFFYMRKGDALLRRMGRANVFDYVRPDATNRIHPTEKPRELMRDILSTLTWDGSKILSPFLGSGITILAAYDLRMTCIGYDLSEEFKNAYAARVLKEVRR